MADAGQGRRNPPFSRAELVQWAQAAARRVVQAPFEEVRQALASAGRSFDLTQLRQRFLAAQRQVGLAREIIRSVANQPMPLSAYAIWEGVQRTSFRYIISADIRYAQSGLTETRYLTVVSDRSLSAAEWENAGREAFQERGRLYGYNLVRIELVQGYRAQELP